jgi:hypothetical protein
MFSSKSFSIYIGYLKKFAFGNQANKLKPENLHKIIKLQHNKNTIELHAKNKITETGGMNPPISVFFLPFTSPAHARGLNQLLDRPAFQFLG